VFKLKKVIRLDYNHPKRPGLKLKLSSTILDTISIFGKDTPFRTGFCSI